MSPAADSVSDASSATPAPPARRDVLALGAGLLLGCGHGRTRGEPGNLMLMPEPVVVPPALERRLGGVEASGVAWAPSLGRYLVVVDDTIDAMSGEREAPFVLAMSGEGELDESPVAIEGIERLDDAESICAAGPDRFYLLTSHARDRRGLVRASRRQLLDLRLDGRKLRVERAADLSAGPGGVPELLRRSGVAPDGQFDAEAVAAWEGALYVGLKEPLATGAALLLRIDGAESAFDAGRLREGRLSISARLGLGFPDDKGTSILQGISDMTFAGDGMLYFAANAPDERFSGGGGAIWRVPIPTATPAVRAPEACTRFAKVAPEGLCPTPDGRTLMVVFDRDREVPMWMTWPLPRPSPSPSPSPSGTPPT